MTRPRVSKKLPAPEPVEEPRRGSGLTPDSPLTDRMRECLLGLLKLHDGGRGWDYPATPNRIASAAGYSDGGRRRGNGAAGKGGWAGRMPPSNRVNFAINGLEQRGLVFKCSRPDGLSGLAVAFSNEGFELAKRLQEEQTMANGWRTDAETAGSDEEAVWIVEGYEDAENLAPVRAGDVSFPPGSDVAFPDDHEMYGGSPAVVKAAGKGMGLYEGRVVYDVLPEGCSETERVTEYELEG